MTSHRHPHASRCARVFEWPTKFIAYAALLLTTGTSYADECTGAQLDALAKLEAGLLKCQAQVARRGDAAPLATCHARVAAKFTAAALRIPACAANQASCASLASTCESAVTSAMTDTLPSACVYLKRKAAGTLAKKELGRYARAARRGIGPDATCVQRARDKFGASLASAGDCPDGGSPQGLVEADCVAAMVTMDGDIVAAACPEPTTTSTSATFPTSTTTPTSTTSPTSTTTQTSTTTSTSTSTTAITLPCPGSADGAFGPAAWFFGDSITGSYCPFVQAANPGWQVACLGLMGESTTQGLTRLQSLLAACPPPFAVVIEEAVNDVFWHNFDLATRTMVCGANPDFAPDQILLRLQAMTDAAHAVDPGIATFVATTLYGCGFAPGCAFDDLCEVSNGVLQTFGAAAINFELDTSEFASDLVHPNEAGDGDLAARAIAALAPVVPTTSTTLP